MTLDAEEERLLSDPRLQEAIDLFNGEEWYACHDRLEELWHETAGPMRPVLQGILQIAVAQLHHANGNRRGATVLTGEGLGRLRTAGGVALGLNLSALRSSAGQWLQALQADEVPTTLAPPALVGASTEDDWPRQ